MGADKNREVRVDPVPEEPGPGRRSGIGTESLWSHLQQDADRKAETRVRATNVADRSVFTVLVVDDTESARYAMARVLRAAGYKTIEAASGAEALQLAAGASAIVLDVHLLDLHGLEVARLLRSRPGSARVPFVHVWAVYVEPQDREASTGVGANAYLTAPVAPQDLVDAVDALIARAVSGLGAPDGDA